MSKLIRMPDGSWMHPKYILGIEAVDTTDLYSGGYYGPRVIIHLNGDRRCYECANFEAACAIRDELSEMVNATPKEED